MVAFISLAANTGCGKTALALQIADAVASEDSSVLFITLEMDESQLTARRLARVAKVPASHLIMQRLSDDEYEHIRQQLPALKQKHLVFSSEGVFTVSNIQALAGQVPNLRLVIIDYLGILQSESVLRESVRGNYRYLQCSKGSRSITRCTHPMFGPA